MVSVAASSLPTFMARNPESFADRISRMAPDTAIRRLRAGGFCGEAAAVVLPSIRLARIGVHNFDVTGPAGRGYSSVTIPLLSGFRILDRGTTHEYGPTTAHFQAFDRPFHLQAEDTVVFVVNIADALLTDVMTRLAGNRSETRLGLCGQVSLMDARAAVFWRDATKLWCDVRRDSSLAKSTIALREREMALIEQLLMSLRQFEGSQAVGFDDACLRGTEDWILAHLEDPITRADLCAVSGMNVRTLTRAFRRRHALSPMAFVRERRLDEVRRRLLAGDREETSVSNVALDHGFGHLGRFSADYRRAFGELPSETLRH
jgi:AraC-like DNA-binding protein